MRPTWSFELPICSYSADQTDLGIKMPGFEGANSARKVSLVLSFPSIRLSIVSSGTIGGLMLSPRRNRDELDYLDPSFHDNVPERL